jgi:hypothetical protein
MLINKKCILSIGYLGGIVANLEEFTWSWGTLLLTTHETICGPNEFIYPMRSKTSVHSIARNQLAENFLGDFLLQLDTDHCFDSSLASRMYHLMQTYNLDILTGAYTRRDPPYLPLLFKKHDNLYTPLITWEKGHKLHEIDGCGGGCLMVRRRVYDKIKEVYKCGPFDPISPLSEDLSFCKRCTDLGFKIYFSQDIECHHLIILQTSLTNTDLSGLGITNHTINSIT